MDAKTRFEEIVDDVLARHGDVEQTQMMGMPSLKRNGKLVAGLWKETMAFKLSDAAKRDQALAIVNKLASHVNHPAGDDVYKAMQLLLDDEDYQNFVAAAARLSKTAQISKGVVGGVVRPLPPPPTVR